MLVITVLLGCMDVLPLSVDEKARRQGACWPKLFRRPTSLCCRLLNLNNNVRSPSFSSSFYLIRRPTAIGSAVYLVFAVYSKTPPHERHNMPLRIMFYILHVKVQ